MWALRRWSNSILMVFACASDNGGNLYFVIGGGHRLCDRGRGQLFWSIWICSIRSQEVLVRERQQEFLVLVRALSWPEIRPFLVPPNFVFHNPKIMCSMKGKHRFRPVFV